ncbi:MAG: helix-turn-helix domain-containing protein [Saprospiraceae bacterium]|nr:helix-turn-helix domain-containing protein [Saprospiraceae bacterium]
MNNIPTLSICNLVGSDPCITEFLITRIRDFLTKRPNLSFPHRHKFFQIVLFTEGSGEHSIDFKKFPVAPHQAYVMGPGQVHSWNFGPDTDGFILNFNDSFISAFCNDPNYLQSLPLFNSLSASPARMLEAECCGEVHRLLERLLLEYQQEKDFKLDMLRTLVLQVLILLSRQLPAEVHPGTTSHQRTVLRQFEQLIDAHFREKRLPRDYAEMLFITPNHLNALVNSVVGKPAGELIRDRVVLEAKRLLANSDANISEIADTLNFEDNAYFTRFFKKYTGITPELFRQSFSKNARQEVDLP